MPGYQSRSVAAGASIHGITTAEPLITATTVRGFAAHAAAISASSSACSRRRAPVAARRHRRLVGRERERRRRVGGSGGTGASRPTRGSSIGGNSVNRSAFVLSMYSPSSAFV